MKDSPPQTTDRGNRLLDCGFRRKWPGGSSDPSFLDQMNIGETPTPVPSSDPSQSPPASELPPSEDAVVPESDPAPAQTSDSESDRAAPSQETSSRPPMVRGSGPLAAMARGSGPLAARGLGVAKPASPTSPAAARPRKSAAKGGEGEGREGGEQRSAGTDSQGRSEAESQGPPESPGQPKAKSKGKPYPRPRLAGEGGNEATPEKPQRPSPVGKIAVPSTRQALSNDLQAELDAELAQADIEAILGGDAGMADRREPLSEGARVQSKVLKVHGDSVFVALGGPDEGVIPLLQFADAEPEPGQTVEVMVRGFQAADGLYILSLPGQTVDVADWTDLEEGSVVEVTVTGSNTGGLECTVGSVRGFIPISQIAENRVEDASDYVGQKLVCLVNEASERRGNLVLSHRAILEREREEKRREQLEKIEVGDTFEGTVRSVKDFGAFVDLGGLDGLIHVSKLSWDRIKHPSEVIQEGQKVKVKIETVDKQSGKIGLSYRDLLENPWDTAEEGFPVGSIQRGTVTRIAAFGCFVRLAAGVEGLVHISELAHHRVSKISAFINEGDEVEVKVLSFDRESQKIGLSIKAAQALASDAKTSDQEDPEPDAPPRDPAVKPMHAGPLRGGNNRDTGGERFGLRW